MGRARAWRAACARDAQRASCGERAGGRAERAHGRAARARARGQARALGLARARAGSGGRRAPERAARRRMSRARARGARTLSKKSAPPESTDQLSVIFVGSDRLGAWKGVRLQ